MSELITYNLTDYEEKAVALAQQPGELARIRQHLAEEKNNGVLFDTPRFVRNLEQRLQQLVAAL